MLTFGELKSAFESLELENKPAIVHASLRTFGAIEGGAETFLKALLNSVSGLIMPTFTYKPMIIPEVGPPNNGLSYGTQLDGNRMAEAFHVDMPADKLMGVLPEIFRHQPGVKRTAHPLLSFAGFNVQSALSAQTLYNPFAPISKLADEDGWVLLLGVNHTSNTSIHYAEKLAGRPQFVRWALTKKRIVECPRYPGCSDGFEDIRPEIEDTTRRVEVGRGAIEAIPLSTLLKSVETSIKRDPRALLCQRDICARCDAIRSTI